MLLQNTLMPYVTMIESAMNAKLLTPQEIEQGYYFAFDTSEMLRLTPQDQAQFMTNLYKEGIVNLEEVRTTLGLGADSETIAELKSLQQAKYNSTMSELNGANESTTNEETKPASNAGKEINPNSSKEVQEDEKNGV